MISMVAETLGMLLPLPLPHVQKGGALIHELTSRSRAHEPGSFAPIAIVRFVQVATRNVVSRACQHEETDEAHFTLFESQLYCREPANCSVLATQDFRSVRGCNSVSVTSLEQAFHQEFRTSDG